MIFFFYILFNVMLQVTILVGIECNLKFFLFCFGVMGLSYLWASVWNEMCKYVHVCIHIYNIEIMMGRNYMSNRLLLGDPGAASVADGLHTAHVKWQFFFAHFQWHLPLRFALWQFFVGFLSTHSVSGTVGKIGLRNIFISY